MNRTSRIRSHRHSGSRRWGGVALELLESLSDDHRDAVRQGIVDGRGYREMGLVGRFYGRCDPGAHRWALEFLDETGVVDFVYYRLGAGPTHRVDELPGESLTWRFDAGRVPLSRAS